MNETRFPLTWPNNWKRTTNRTRAAFGKEKTEYDPGGSVSYGGRQRLTVAGALDRISVELRRMGVNENNVIVSTNVELNLSGVPRSGRSEPSDPGAAIYWKHKGKNQCMAIDRYDRVADNLAAIAATLAYLRGIERHGGGSILERAFIGFAQLSAGLVTPRPWRDVLGIAGNNVTVEFVEAQYRSLARVRHPDSGGSHDLMAELNAARVAALQEIV